MRVLRTQYEHCRFEAGNTIPVLGQHVIPLEQLILAATQYRGKQCHRLAQFKASHLGRGPKCQHLVIVSVDATRLPVEHVHALKILLTFAVVGQSRARHRTARTDHQRALVVELAGGGMHALQPDACIRIGDRRAPRQGQQRPERRDRRSGHDRQPAAE